MKVSQFVIYMQSVIDGHVLFGEKLREKIRKNNEILSEVCKSFFSDVNIRRDEDCIEARTFFFDDEVYGDENDEDDEDDWDYLDGDHWDDPDLWMTLD